MLDTLIRVKMVLVFLAFLASQNLRGQGILEAYIKEGLANNLALQREELDVQKSLEALRYAKGNFLPEVSFAASYTLAGGGRTIDIPVGDLVNPINQTLNQLTDTQNFPMIENESENFLPNDFHDTRFQIRQSIFNSSIYYNHKAQQLFVTAQEAQRDAYRQELIKEIKTAYFNYLKTIEVKKILVSTKTVLQEVLDLNQSLFKNGKVTVDAVYSSKFELSDLEGQQSSAERDNEVAEAYFNLLLNRDLDSPILVDSIILEHSIPENLTDLQSRAINSRNELRQTKSAIEANQQLLKLNKSLRLPQLSAGASLGYQGFGYQFDSDQDYSLLQFNLEVPVFTGFKNNSKIQIARLDLQKLENQETELEKKIKLEVLSSYKNNEAEKAKLISRRKALNSAKRSFQIVKRKYEESQVLLVELMDSRTNYTNAQLSLAISKYDLLISQAELERTIAL